jgi:hypothetical protein
VSQQLTPSAPARRTPSKKALVLAWVDHLPRISKEALHDQFDTHTMMFRYPVSKNKWFVTPRVSNPHDYVNHMFKRP